MRAIRRTTHGWIRGPLLVVPVALALGACGTPAPTSSQETLPQQTVAPTLTPAPTAEPTESETPTSTPPVTTSSTSSTTKATESSTTSTSASPTTTKVKAKEDYRGTRGLTPKLTRALVAARQEAAPDGVKLSVTSGSRDASVQARLFRNAVKQYGSEAEARRWVLPPEDSSHVQGRAIDVGPRSGARWLELHGAQFGLCRTYRNEWWHFERVGSGGSCPPMYRDAAAAAAAGE